MVAELVGERVDRVPGGLDVGAAVAEAFGGEIGERHQVGRVDGGRGGRSVAGILNIGWASLGYQLGRDGRAAQAGVDTK